MVFARCTPSSIQRRFNNYLEVLRHTTLSLFSMGQLAEPQELRFRNGIDPTIRGGAGR